MAQASPYSSPDHEQRFWTLIEPFYSSNHNHIPQLFGYLDLEPESESYLKSIEQQDANIRVDHLQAQLESELHNLEIEYAVDNWDGDDAAQVLPKTVELARKLIKSFPSWLPTPELFPEADGSICFEWYKSPTKLITVSIDSNGIVVYSSLNGNAREYGSDKFDVTIHQKLANRIREVLETQDV